MSIAIIRSTARFPGLKTSTSRLAGGHIATAAAQAVTIIGIPLAIANVKMIPVTCFPFGKEIVSSR